MKRSRKGTKPEREESSNRSVEGEDQGTGALAPEAWSNWTRDRLSREHPGAAAEPPSSKAQEEVEVDDFLRVSTAQRPAAYRFGIQEYKIHALSERPTALDARAALDIYNELVEKARFLRDRLTQTNSVRQVQITVDLLLEVLGAGFENLRPGVLLSRARNMESDRTAFDTTEARAELFPDAISMMDSTLQTLRDLLSLFPIVRRMELERLALDLDRRAQHIPVIREQMDLIAAAAASSDATTQEAVNALQQNEASIEHAQDPLVKTSLVADQLLVERNFINAIIGGVGAAGRVIASRVGVGLNKTGAELGEVGGELWQAVRTELPKGVGIAVSVAPILGLLTLAGYILGPVTAIGAVLPVFKPIADAMRRLLSHSGDKGPNSKHEN